MTCPLCGDPCRCSYVPPSDGAHVSVLIDPDERSDMSEQQFNASLEETTNAYDGATLEAALAHQATEPPATEVGAAAPRQELLEGPGYSRPEETWRDEVASRVNEYRARRRRTGRPMPSLAFDFDSASAYVPDQASATPVMVHRSGHAVVSEAAVVNPRRARMLPFEQQPPIPKVIEFPKPPAPQPQLPLIEELAEPIVESPRILDVPEPPPAAEPLQSAPIVLDEPAAEPPAVVSVADLIEYEIAPQSARVYAFIIDAMFLAGALVVFGLVQVKLMNAPPFGRFALFTAFALPFLFWSVYQWAFLYFCATTPGMQMARLCLIRFDGQLPSRPLRAARAFAMVLSACSLGLGFAWSALDEHRLCWHDRITRTHLVQL